MLLYKLKKKAIDGYYWSLNRKESIKQKKYPPILRQYILEVKQWYPPLFGMLIAKFSKNVLESVFLFITSLYLLRLGIMIFLYIFLDLNFNLGSFLSVLIIFFSSPILSYYDTQINSRILGAIVLDLLVVLWIIFFHYPNYYLFIPICILTIILLFLHKMSLQLYITILFGLSFTVLSIYPLITFSLCLSIALLFFGYGKYVIAHFEIIRFWNKYKFKLGAHQFYESPIYGVFNYQHENRLHGGGFSTLTRKIKLSIAMFPMLFFWFINSDTNTLFYIILSSVFLVFGTLFIPFLYAFGAGILYYYNLVSFVCFYFIIYPFEMTLINSLFFGLCLLASLYSIFSFYQKNKNNEKNIELDQVINFINNSTLDRLMIFPFQLPDKFALKTNKQVFWGGHGLGFLWLERYFPIMQDPVEQAIKDWNIGSIILDKNYWPEFYDNVDQSLFNIEYENDQYCVFSVINWKKYSKIPIWAVNLYPNLDFDQ